MKRRYIDADIWEKKWFRELKPNQKMAIIYLFTKCDHAGIWEVDFGAMKFYLGDDPGDIRTFLPESFQIIEINSDTWFFPKFLKFQYPKTLNSAKAALVSVVNRLKEYDLIATVNELFGDNYLMIMESSNDDHGIIKSNSKDKDKVIDKDNNLLKSSIVETVLSEHPDADEVVANKIADLMEFNIKKHWELFGGESLDNQKIKKWPDAFYQLIVKKKKPPEQIEKLLEYVYDPLYWWGSKKAFRSPAKFLKGKDGTSYYDIILGQYETRNAGMKPRGIKDLLELEARK